MSRSGASPGVVVSVSDGDQISRCDDQCGLQSRVEVPQCTVDGWPEVGAHPAIMPARRSPGASEPGSRIQIFQKVSTNRRNEEAHMTTTTDRPLG